jgi:gentisate 1,2-dioxygenase
LILSGNQSPYREYRDRYAHPQSQPVIWRWRDLTDELRTAEHTEYGTLTLSKRDGDNEIVPGAALTVQVVKAGERTTSHCHSWWHVYFVRAGTGTVTFDDLFESVDIHPGDVLLIPAWVVHHFENDREGPEDIMLLSMTNLPQQAALDNRLSREAVGETV